MNNQVVLDKIKKLMSLGGNNPNKTEAAAALKKAATIAEKYGLSISDIDPETKKVDMKEGTLKFTNKKDLLWMGVLTKAMKQCFECEVIYLSVFNFDLQQRIYDLRFIGMKTDVDMAVWYMKHLQIQIKRGSEKKYKASLSNKKLSYCLGAATVIASRLSDIFVKTKEDSRTDTTSALVVIKKDAVSLEFKQRYPKYRTEKIKGSSVNSEAYAQGKMDGKKMNITKQINS